MEKEKEKVGQKKSAPESDTLQKSAAPPAFSLEANPIQKQDAGGGETTEAAAGETATAEASTAIDATTVTITYGTNADSSTVKATAETVIKEIVAKSGGTSCTITSTARTPEAQARAMYNNLVGTGEGQGVTAQRELYGPYGDQVIDTFEAEKEAGKTADEIKAAMAAKIIELGPGNVSKHCADSNTLCVVDIAPSSITNGTKFEEEVDKDSRVSKFLKPPDDPAYHLEIPV